MDTYHLPNMPVSWHRMKGRTIQNPVERFMSYVDKSGACWLWTGGRERRGYGFFWYGQRLWSAHRFSYMIHNGEIPSGLTIDHVCRNPQCVNPAHLEAVTQKVNNLRGMSDSAANSRKTHCKRGHAFTDENTWRDKRNKRRCRICHRTAANALIAKRIAAGMSSTGKPYVRPPKNKGASV